MALNQKEIDALLQLVGLTREQELDCDGCLEHVAEFVERELAGRSVPEGLSAVAHHLAICPECQEEYQVLQNALAGLEG